MAHYNFWCQLHYFILFWGVGGLWGGGDSDVSSGLIWKSYAYDLMNFIFGKLQGIFSLSFGDSFKCVGLGG